MNIPNRQIRSALLEVKNLSLSFNDQRRVAVDRVSFSIAAGTTLGLVGSSGAGKSSIARAIMCLLAADSGEILFSGDNIFKMNPDQLAATRQRVQIVFQDPSASLSPRRTVRQTLLEPLDHFNIGNPDSRNEKILQTLVTVGLAQDVLQRYPHQLSTGQQQRIAIARALVTDPELLIADEAVSSLDVSIQAQILQLIQSLQREHRIAFLFISHDLAVIRQIADEVAVMYRGQLLEQSPADIFFSRPAHPYSKALLSFASDTPPNLPADKAWRLDRGRTIHDHLPACLFADRCPERMPLCERSEPASFNIQQENQHTTLLHCVKCHLYNEAKPYEA
jgi:oligopeptide/dipeptide ABC transporter ATP-binding protein